MWILRSSDNGDGKAIVFRILPGSIKTIGRAGNADFVVEETLVSRVHCRLVATSEGELHLEDLSSTNGTFVNDQRVSQAALAAGDRVRLGQLDLTVERIDEGEDQEATRDA